MTVELGSLQANLSLETSAFEANMKKARGSLTSHTVQMKRSVDSLKTSFEGIKSAAVGFVGVMAAQKVTEYAGAVIKTADAFNQLNARIKNSLEDASQFDSVFQDLVASSNRSGLSIDDAASAFVRLRSAAKDLGVNNEQLIQFNETFAKMGSLAGATSDEMQNAMVQLSQGLSTGVLRGQDLKSVMEQMPGIARTIADSMGIPFDKFRAAAEKGQITSDKVFKAILEKSAEVDTQFSKLPPSVDRSMNRISNSLQKAVGQLNEASGATTELAQLMDKTASTVDANSAAFSDLAGQLLRTTVEAVKLHPLFWNLGDSIERISKINLADWMINVSSGLDVVTTKAQQAANWVGKFVANIGNTFQSMGNTSLFGQLDAKTKKDFDFKNASLEAQLAQRQQQRLNLKLQSMNLGFGNGSSTPKYGGYGNIRRFSPGGSGSGGKAGKTGKKTAKSDAEKEMDRLKQEADSLKQSMRTIWEVEADEIAKANKLLKLHLIDQQTYNRALDEAKDKSKKAFQVDGLDEAVKKFMEPHKKFLDDFSTGLGDALDNTAFQEVQKVIQDTMTPLEQYNQQVEYLNYLHDNAGLSTEAWTRALADAQETLTGSKQKADEFAQAVGNVVSQFGDKFFDTFVNGLKTGQMAFGDFVASALEDLAKLIFKLTVTIPLAEALTNALKGSKGKSSGGGSVGGVVGNIISGIATSLFTHKIGVGDYTSNANTRFAATGADTGPGQPFIVGEKGPELFVPRSAGNIVPHGEFGVGGGNAIHVTNVFQISTGVAPTVRAELMKMMPDIEKRTTSAVLTASSRGGKMSQAMGKKS